MDDPANIREHLRILQSIITRMAENSRYCKAWCIALVSAILIFVARSGPHACYMWIATVPIIGFLFPGYVLLGTRVSISRILRAFHRITARRNTRR